MGMAISVPRYTVDELEQFPDDGNRYELLDGVLLVTPAPKAVHQNVVSHLHVALATAIQKPGLARVVGPGAISVPPNTQLQPDILVYPSRFGPMVEWARISEHWLAVEVLSRSSRVYDRLFKRDAYFVLGVPQVWLVDIADRSVEVWRTRTEHEVVRDVIRWRVPTLDVVVPIDLAEVFTGVE
jgi:Uma2 family endonuclease